MKKFLFLNLATDATRAEAVVQGRFQRKTLVGADTIQRRTCVTTAMEDMSLLRNIMNMYFTSTNYPSLHLLRV